MRRVVIGWVICSAGALACAACSNTGTREAQRAGETKAAPRKVELVQAETAPMDQRIVIAGTLAAQDEVAIKAKVPGRLAAIHVDLGSVVKRGQVLAEIEAVDYRLRVEQALAALGQARAALGLAPDDDAAEVDVENTSGVREASATLAEVESSLERARSLIEKKLIGRAELESASAAHLRAESAVARAREEVYARIALLKQRKAELALARQQLSDASIRAPLDGVVQLRKVSAGELLAQGADLVTVVRIDPLRLRVEVPERDAARVSVGQTVSLRVDDQERVYAGRIARLAPMLDAQNRTLTVEAEIPNPGTLRPGSFARAVIALGASAPVLTVPKSAIVVFAGIAKVITVKDGKAVETPIEVGRATGDRVEVIKGLDAGASVVRAPGSLQQGQPVALDDARRGPSAALHHERAESVD